MLKLIMLFSLFYAFVFWLTLILSLIPAFYILILKIMGLEKLKESCIRTIANKWAVFLMFLGRQKTEVIGLDNLPEHDNICFISNHQSYADILILFANIPKRIGFIAKKELSKVPILNIWMIMLNCAFVQRKNLRQSIQTIEKRIGLIEKGYPMVIFPEGNRAKDGRMRKFKHGSVAMAGKHGVTIVPVTIDGLFRAYELNNRITPAASRLVIHPPVETENLTRVEIKALPEQVERTVEGSLTIKI